MFKVNNKNTRMTSSMPEWDFKWLKSHLGMDDAVLVFLLLTLNIFPTFSSVFIVDFEQIMFPFYTSWKQGFQCF